MGQQMALSCGLLAAQKLHKTCTNCTELPCSAPHPLHLYPESPQKLHPNVQLNAPAPRINSRIFLFVKAQGDGAANCPHHLKVANPAASMAPSPFEGVRLAAGGAIASPSGGPGGLPPANLCLLSFRKKVGRGAGRSARSRGVQRGSAPRIVGRRDPRPCKIPRGAGLKRSRNRKKVVAKKANLYDNKGEPK